MMKNLLKWIGCILCLVLSLSLCACGTKTEKGPVPASEAFKNQKIWYYVSPTHNMIEKDTRVLGVFIFDENDKVTVYHSLSLEMKDFKDLEDTEVLELVKAHHKEAFEKLKQERIAFFDESIDSYQEMLHLDIDDKDGIDTIIEVLSKLRTKIENAVYVEPEAVDYRLEATTDGSGNFIEDERLIFQGEEHWSGNHASFLVKHIGEVAPETTSEAIIEGMENELTANNWSFDKILYTPKEYSISLQPQYAGSQVYEKFYMGYEDIVTEVATDFPGFTFDLVGAEGVEILE